MIDIKLLREQPDLWRQELKNRHLKAMPSGKVDEFLDWDKKRRALIQKKNELEQVKNEFSAKVVQTQGEEEKAKMIMGMKKNKEQLQVLREELEKKEAEIKILLDQFPNLSDHSVSVASDASGNAVDHQWGEPSKFDFKPKSHYELGEALDLIDIKKGAQVSGARFWYLKNELVSLEFALIQYVLDILIKKGFTPILPPMLVREAAMYGTGFFPADKNEIYELTGDEKEKLYLIGTAEVVLAAYHMDEILGLAPGKPKLYMGFSSCFRREAGAYGKDLKGILRGHQFDKLEMFAFATQEDSWQVYEMIVKIVEEIWQGLGIHYQAVNIATGDLGAPNAKKIDLEAWLPSESCYREVVSASHDTDFQARRLNIKYKDEKGNKKFVHTINSTAIAIGRVLIAIMENYQRKDGSIEVPKILQKYCGFKEIKR
ncbi:MAG: serine--tRNA ligase [Patescibacteria group bacterium]|nr:serine--tRNA ligase [Patescibacteria group bacterium]